MSSAVLVDRIGDDLARITLNRPDAHFAVANIRIGISVGEMGLSCRRLDAAEGDLVAGATAPARLVADNPAFGVRR